VAYSVAVPLTVIAATYVWAGLTLNASTDPGAIGMFVVVVAVTVLSPNATNTATLPLLYRRTTLDPLTSASEVVVSTWTRDEDDVTDRFTVETGVGRNIRRSSMIASYFAVQPVLPAPLVFT
jgi:hypothetical protein